MIDEDYINKLNKMMDECIKISILNASPRAFSQMIRVLDEDNLKKVLELYEFSFSNPYSRNDPYFIANYTYIRHYMTTKMVFQPIKIKDRTILFCNN